MKLYLGFGPQYEHQEGNIVVDIVPKWADVVWDLNDGPPPVKGKFDYIEAHHVFEHIESHRVLKDIMRWAYRHLEKGGTFDIAVPHWHSESAVECIEHCHLFNENSFMNFYDNPYYKEMKLPKFVLLDHRVESVGPHNQVRVILSK